MTTRSSSATNSCKLEAYSAHSQDPAFSLLLTRYANVGYQIYDEKSTMHRLSKASQSTNDASAWRANTAGWQKHEHSGQKWHTKHQTVGAVNGATRLTPEISAPKAGLAAEHRRNTAFSHLLTMTWGLHSMASTQS